MNTHTTRMKMALLTAGAASLAFGTAAVAHDPATDAEATTFARDAGAPPIKRCANMGNMFEQPKGRAWNGREPVTRDYTEIAALGFDTVRLPVRFSAYAGNEAPYTLDEAFMAKIDKSVDDATAAGLNIIVDMHHYDELFADPAGHADRFVGIWKQIAARYADRPNNVLFETINEPHNKLTNDVVEPLHERVLAVIRETNPTRRVIVGGDFWSGISSLETFDPPKDPNIIATFHFYEPFAFSHQGASWVDPSPPAPRKFGIEDDAEWFNKMTRATRAFTERTGTPLFLGEFGAIDSADLTERVRYTYAVRRHAERLDIPWCVWSYTNTFHVRRDDGWIPDMLAALGLPPEE